VFDLPAFRIGRVFGIPIEINATWLVIFGFLSFSLATGYFGNARVVPEAQGSPAWVYALVAIISAVLFFASLVLHELAHSLVARAGGVPVKKITLFLLGGVSQMEEEPHSPGKEFVMAFAGPGTSLLIGAVAFITGIVLERLGAPWWLYSPLGYLGFVNVLLGVFNLIPGFPMDGGRVLRSILWGITGDLVKSTRWAARVGQVFGWSMIALFVANLLTAGRLAGGDPFQYFWLGLIGWFITTMAGTAYRQVVIKDQLSRFVVANAMTPSPQAIPGEITLEDAAHQYFLGGRHSRYPVLADGQIVGIITLPLLKDVPRNEWPFRSVVDTADKDLASLVVDAATHVDDTLARLVPDRPGALLVVSGGRMVGILTRADVIDLLQRAGAVQGG
jgi:Zn-dependent protease/CBS domain-containing protein